MVFKALQDKFKVKSGKKFLKGKLNNLSTPSSPATEMTSIGCIVDMDNFPNADVFYELRNELGLRPNAIQIIGYKRAYDKISPFGIQYFTDNDLGWNGTIENGFASEFLNRDYDVLINYFTKETLLLKLIATQTKARLRIGLRNVDERLNDLILNTSFNDFEAFKGEVKKYLGAFGEIEK